MKSKDIIITDTDMCPFELVDMDFNMVEVVYTVILL